MKSLMKNAALFASLVSFGAAAPAAVLPAAAPTVVDDATGSAIVRVLHEVTREPLARMPVHVVSLGVQDPLWIGSTNRNGEVSFSGMLEGPYLAYVTYNDFTSSVRFEITAADHTIAVLYFNPDIG